jgi:acyl-CoA reductase-like NAD-dependent aldehyde dehydrogenase
MTATQLLIGLEWVDVTTGATGETINPAIGQTITTFAEASAADVDAAVSAARPGFEPYEWQSMTPDARGRILWKFADLI